MNAPPAAQALAREKPLFAALDDAEMVPQSRVAGRMPRRIARTLALAGVSQQPRGASDHDVRASGTRSARALPFTFTSRPASRRWLARWPCWRSDF